MCPVLSPVNQKITFGIGPVSTAENGALSADPDLESGNKAMDAAFDFESAASSPSLLKPENVLQPMGQRRSSSANRGLLNSSAAKPLAEAAAASSVRGLLDYLTFNVSGLTKSPPDPYCDVFLLTIRIQRTVFVLRRDA
jgi:hypothetical protein